MENKRLPRFNLLTVLALMGLAASVLLGVISSVHASQNVATLLPRDERVTRYAPSATLVVTSTANDGPGTLRWAVQTAVASDTITFDPTVFSPTIPVTIALLSALPSITQGHLTIDASDAGVILDGSGTPPGTNGLFLSWPGGNVIRGLSIVNFPGVGVYIVESSNNVVGGDRKRGSGPNGEGNLISGNGSDGIVLQSTLWYADNMIRGNYIGVNAAGDVAMPNSGAGIRIPERMVRTVIGGLSEGEGNVISGNSGDGIVISWECRESSIIGNRIGTDAAGMMPIPNGGNGVSISNEAQYNIIGGGTTGRRNLISGNHGNGVYLGGNNTVSNTISGNYIGTNISGTAALSNDGSGVAVMGGASYNVIGGNSADARNVLSGNRSEGILIFGSTTVSNTVSGNYIGTNASGTAGIGNAGGGIDLHQSAFNVIGGNNATPGGACTGECNLISGNTGDNGISIFDNGSVGNIVRGNYIGTNVSGTQVLSNTNSGVYIRTNALYNVIGGKTPGERNLISGNNSGIGISDSGAISNTIIGNYIGTDVSGMAALRNDTDGVNITSGAQYNIVGGNTPAERNLISGNGRIGVLIGGGLAAHYNTVIGNYIGTDASGTYPISNTTSGLIINSGSQYNQVLKNVLSGNTEAGLNLNGSDTMSNTVSGNLIGITADGLLALPNRRGIHINNGARNNVIGGITAGERNIIGGNTLTGVEMSTGAAGNVVIGNYIGTNISGMIAIGNKSSGVSIDQSANNRIGGSTDAERNVISGNGAFGVMLNSVHHITVTGNYIGTDVTGMTSIRNTYSGLLIQGGASNLVGGDTSGERNVISGNGLYGISIWQSNNNVVRGNYIGADASGTVGLGNAAHGIYMSGAASFNVIGGDNSSSGETCAGGCNLISGNGSRGIVIYEANTVSNTVSGNFIGVNVSGTVVISNVRGGILISGASYNLIGESGRPPGSGCASKCNLIRGNGAGVQVDGSSSFANKIMGNSIYENQTLGIDLMRGGNTELPAPIITVYSMTAGTASGTACANCAIELYSDEHGQGRWFERSAVADASGKWSINKGSAFIGPELTATATDSAGNTSEFGQDWPANPPPPPVFSEPVCGVTNETQPVLGGFAQMGSLIKLGVDGAFAGQAATNDLNRWSTVPTVTLSNAPHSITATATTVWGTSVEARLALTVNLALYYDPVGVTLVQRQVAQHVRDTGGCADPTHSLLVTLWPNEVVTMSVPVRVPTAIVFVEVNSVRSYLLDPDGDGLFTGTFTSPGTSGYVILLAVNVGGDTQTMQIGATIDPDGYVYNARLTQSTGITHTVAGVTVTLYVSDTVRHRWVMWDAALYGQVNPQVTGTDGHFSFFTPPGTFKLVVDGRSQDYELYESTPLAVIDEPIRYNVPLLSQLNQRIYLPLVLRN